MSKRNAVFARDLRVGDTIRLVYEIEVTSIDDLDAKLPCESADMFFIKGYVSKGPLRGRDGEFAINGDHKLSVTHRVSAYDQLKNWFKGRPSKVVKTVKVLLPPPLPTNAAHDTA